MALKVKPLTLKQANEAVASLHRHHKPARGHRFSLGVYDGERLCGAAVVGRPVAREIPQYQVAEVTRLVTDGTRNACSILYSSAARACAAMGFESIGTYILAAEKGTSLRAAGWVFVRLTTGGDWNHSEKNKGTRRVDQPMGPKQYWQKALN